MILSITFSDCDKYARRERKSRWFCYFGSCNKIRKKSYTNIWRPRHTHTHTHIQYPYPKKRKDRSHDDDVFIITPFFYECGGVSCIYIFGILYKRETINNFQSDFSFWRLATTYIYTFTYRTNVMLFWWKKACASKKRRHWGKKGYEEHKMENSLAKQKNNVRIYVEKGIYLTAGWGRQWWVSDYVLLLHTKQAAEQSYIYQSFIPILLLR